MTLKDVEDLGDDISPEENDEIMSEDDSDELDEQIDLILNDDIDYDFVAALGAYDRLITLETCPERIKVLKELLQGYLEDNR